MKRKYFKVIFVLFFLQSLLYCKSDDDFSGTYVGNFKELKDTIWIANSNYSRKVYDIQNKLMYKQSGKAIYFKAHNNVCFYGFNYVIKNPNEQLSNVDESGSITMAKEGFFTIQLRNTDDIYYEKLK